MENDNKIISIFLSPKNLLIFSHSLMMLFIFLLFVLSYFVFNLCIVNAVSFIFHTFCWYSTQVRRNSILLTLSYLDSPYQASNIANIRTTCFFSTSSLSYSFGFDQILDEDVVSIVWYKWEFGLPVAERCIMHDWVSLKHSRWSFFIAG